MPSNWKNYKLGDIAEVQTGPFGSQLHMKDYKKIGTPIITVEHLGDNKIIHNDLPLVGDDDKERLIKYILHEGDIVFSRVGSVDRRAYVTHKEDGWMFSGRCLRVRPKHSHVNSRFLSFYFGQEKFKEIIRKIAVGATMPSINTTILSEVTIFVPDLPTQMQIASILSSFDDKIELLRQMNQTLETMAQTIFKEWFVDFNFPGFDGVLVEGLPKGWRKGKLGEILQPKKGKNITKSQVIEGEIPVVAGGLEPSCYHNEANTKAPVVTVSSSGANAGFVRLYHTPVWSSDSCFVDNSVYQYVYYYYLIAKSNQGIIYKSQEGCAQPHIYARHIMDLEFNICEEIIVAKFEEIVAPMFEKIKENSNQLRSLAYLRDALLPKLMNGQVKLFHV